MSSLGTALFTASAMLLGCGGGPQAQAGLPQPPLAATAPTNGSTQADTGYIRVPALVSAGMTQVLASVPVLAGATYAWSVTGGSIPGITRNAAVYFDAGAVGTAVLTCVVTLNGASATYTQSVPVVPVMPVAPAFYGSGCGADALANTVVGGASGNVVSYRFQARYSTPLNGVRLFFIWSATKLGYAAGLGGTIRVDLLADDRTAAHLPTGQPLASTSYGNVITQNNFYPYLAFPSPVVLQGGGFYHLVFTNVDPDPVSNYVSLDTLYTSAQTAPMQPTLSDTAWAVLYKPAGGAWRVRPGYTPTLDLDFGAAHQGNGYMEVWSTNPKPISGPAQVRETFKVAGPSRLFSKVLLRLSRVAGDGPLTVRVEEADGTLVDQVDVPAQSILAGVDAWITVPFPMQHVLNTGVGYHLTLQSPADTTYQAYPLRKGLDKGFALATVFPDGYAQCTATGDAGWKGWDMWGTPNLTFSDLQFAFVP